MRSAGRSAVLAFAGAATAIGLTFAGAQGCSSSSVSDAGAKPASCVAHPDEDSIWCLDSKLPHDFHCSGSDTPSGCRELASTADAGADAGVTNWCCP
jgi:hypothetical protein